MTKSPARWIVCLLFGLAACTSESANPTATPPVSLSATVPVTLYPTATLTVSPAPTASPVLSSPLASQLDTPTPLPTATPVPSPTATPVPTETPLPPHPPEAIRGINVANSDSAKTKPLQALGFTWIQTFLPPTVSLEPFKVLYRVTLGKSISGRAEDITEFTNVIDGVVRQHGAYIDAYSIGNEVNLSREWGGNTPDPVLYAKLLGIAYARIKAGDPTAVVVSAGLAPTGGDGPGYMDDLGYAQAMLNAGAGSSFDAYGFHPYGFAYPPEQAADDPNTSKGLAFRRAEWHRALLEKNGLAGKLMWATEFGWFVDAKEEGKTCAHPDFVWQRVSRQQQAEYVVRAFAYAKANWPWMERMFLWNYDFSRSPLYPDDCEQMKWFSMLDLQGNPRPVVKALQQLP